MGYLELTFSVPEDELTSEILAAQLIECGFDSFMEDVPGLFKAYIEESIFSQDILNELLANEMLVGVQHLKSEPLPDKNWNAAWEAAYDPVIINSKCRIRAPFHEPDPAFAFDIVIEPKMSFGTAHHETTAQMLDELFLIEFEKKSVLDMGSGTAVLAILAKKLGASNVCAIDNDQWAYNNAVENVQMNSANDISVELGDASAIKGRLFDVVIANINRNILLNDMAAYANAMYPNATLLLSGFYSEDLNAIVQEAKNNDLEYLRHRAKNNWVVAVFGKKA